MSRRGMVLSGTLCLLIAGCGGSAIPAAKLSDSRSAVRAAEEVGADRYPKSALHLKMARDQLRVADAHIADGDGDAAALALDRAEADAELALTLARAEQMREQARDAQARVQQLRSRMASSPE